ncbi:MAG: Stk1 family PASTA domain-containing Ser/Thr kinase, partial [Clostridia bacterium]|nr:Stk1 family PASTA domain-containing Ser/Thr kinase [Clostridia bacterium]
MENYVGKRLDGRYEIIEIIGVGGMAVVYKAFDNIDNRIVAVKILKDEYLTNEEFRRRFKNESKAIAVLSHPNIVKVYDVSYGDRLQYIVMEYVEGITLKEYIEQQGVIDTREAVYFVTQILRALQHAHDKGIVHRDIKPQNIMLISDGTIKVTDFGIARFSRSETKTMTETAIGSVHYISPEQAKGSVTDSKSDLYSVGVVLYEMLTGKLPFQSDNPVSVALMHLQKDPARPRQLNPNIPVGLEQIIMRAMQKNPNDRYQSASEMLVDIDEYKRNPNVKFDYSYFVDRQPTKFIPTEQVRADQYRSQMTAQPEPSADRPQTQVKTRAQVAAEEAMAREKRKRQRAVALLVGVLAAVLVLAFVVWKYVLPDKNDLEVPNLVSYNFKEEVMNNDDYKDFRFICETDERSTAAAGTIVRQDPTAGKRIERGGTITLYIAVGVEEIRVPDVYGYMYDTASSILKAANFKVKIEKEPSTKDAGTVLRTDPARDEKVEEGSTITLYVASAGELEPVEVPSLIGLTVDEAKEKLEDAGLALDSARTEYRASSQDRGVIIGHESLGEKVAPGTKIAVYVSTGNMPTQPTESTSETTSGTTEKPTESTTSST